MGISRRDFLKFGLKTAAGIVASAELAKVQYIRRTLLPTDKPFLPNTTFNSKVIETATADFRKKRLQEWFWNADIPFGDEHKTPFEHATEAFARSDLSDFLKSRGPFLFFQESGYDPTKVSKSSAAGIAQIKPDTMQDYGFSAEDRFDPRLATEAAIKHLNKCKQTIARSAPYQALRNTLPQLQNDEVFLDLLTLNAYNAGQSRIIAGLENFVIQGSKDDFQIYKNTSPFELFEIFVEGSTSAKHDLLEKYTKEASEYVYKISALFELHKMYEPNHGDKNSLRRRELGHHYAIAEDTAEASSSIPAQDWKIESIRGVAQIDFWSTEIGQNTPYENFEKIRLLADAHFHLAQAFREGKSAKYLWPEGKTDMHEAEEHALLATDYYSKLWNLLTEEQKKRFRYFKTRIESTKPR